MRTTVACDRRHKIKCIHDGAAPCRGCVKVRTTANCVLSDTATARSSIKHRASSTAAKLRSASSSTTLQLDGITPVARLQKTKLHHAAAEAGDRDLSQHMRKVDKTTAMECCAVFRANFPEFDFFRPQDIERLCASTLEQDMLCLLALTSTCSRYSGQQVGHSEFLTQELQKRMTAPPCLSLIQAFLLMALCSWGDGEGYSAWMYSGCAFRMALVYRSQAMRRPNAGLSPEQVGARESEVRTKWACFVLDKLLSSGKERPSMVSIENMNVCLPSGTDAYAFGLGASQVTYFDLVKDSSMRRAHGTPDFGSQIIIRGIDIWSVIHCWVANGGRTQPGMTDALESPWLATSTWSQLKRRLEDWREEQDDKLKFPQTLVTSYTYLGHGAEAFAFVNQIYYMGLIFLCREFLPFLPRDGSAPSGPVDPPFYHDEAPDGWWIHHTNELFNAATNITTIMRDLRKAGTSFRTPFSGLCTFTAASMNLFATAFPWMSETGAEARQELLSENMAELQEICKVWKIGHEWVRIIDLTRELYSRVTSQPALFQNQSRYDYTTLEKSHNLASLTGLSQPEDEISVDVIGLGGSIPSDGTAQHIENQHRGGAKDHSMPTENLDDILDSQAFQDEDFRLWTYWDDPLLVDWDRMDFSRTRPDA